MLYQNIPHGFPRRLAYIGAWDDTRPIERLPNIRHFVFVDSMPQTDCPNIAEIVCPSEKSVRFWHNVLHRLAAVGFNPDDSESPMQDLTKSTCVTFRNGERTVNYWFNTAWPAAHPALLDEQLRACSHLYLAGFDPHGSILNALSRGPLDIYTAHRTLYYPAFEVQASPVSTMSTFNRLHFDKRMMRRVANVWFFWHNETKYRYGSLECVWRR